MSSDNGQPAYFQPFQDGSKVRSSRKKVYKYTEDQPSATERYRPYENRYNVNDFSFEDRTEKLRTPKREVIQSKREENASPIGGKESSKKKDFNLRINKIENLNDKISSLLKMVPKSSSQAQQKSNRFKQISRESKANFNFDQLENQQSAAPPLVGESPYSKLDEYTKRNRRTQQRRRNFSYLEQLGAAQPPRNIENQENSEQRTHQIDQQTEKESSPISKYKNQAQDQTPLKQDKKPEMSQSILKVNNQSQKKISEVRSRYGGSALLQKYRQQMRNKQKQQKKNSNKENELIEKREQSILNNVELDMKITSVQNRIIGDSPLKLKNYNDALERQYGSRNDQKYEAQRATDQPTLSIMALKLSRLIDLDIILKKIRHSFEDFSNEKKWELLKTELRGKGIFLDEKQLKDLMRISIHEKNPFGDKLEAFPLNGVKDLAKLFAETQRIWNEELNKYISLDDLARQNFEMAVIDINRKGYISIEDLVCFINVHGEKFYRSRDLAQLFRRFLLIQGKNLQKNISDGIGYRTFMGKLTK